MNLRTILVILTSLCASAALAQSVTMGNAYVPYQGFARGAVGGQTYIDLVHPASANGVLFEATFAFGIWAERCPDAVKIKFFRRNGDVLSLIAERGPFDTDGRSDVWVVTLSPPVRVNEGDLIGIVELSDPARRCGGAVFLSNVPGGEYLAYPEDVMGMVQMASGLRRSGTLGLSATDLAADEYPALVVPVVGSPAGLYGSEWRTSIRILNPHDAAVTGLLVFRPERSGGDAEDISIPYDIPPGATKDIPDVGAALGRSGLGSLDLMTNQAPPVLVADIYHDRGNGSRFGMTVDAVDPNDLSCPWSISTGTIMPTRILREGVAGYLIAPGAGTNARFNIGVRTLRGGATIRATLRASAGDAVQTVTKEYGPNYFEQLGADGFFGSSLTGGESIEIEVLTGSAIVYGCTIDNVTNDPSMQYAYSMLSRLEPQPGQDQEE